MSRDFATREERITETTPLTIEDALNRAFALGQSYWADADSEYVSHNKRAEITLSKFRKFRDTFSTTYEKL